MLIPRGLCALLWGTTVLAAGPPFDIASSWLSHAQSRAPILDIFNTTALEAFVDEYRSNHVLQPKIAAKRLDRGPRIPLLRSDDSWKQLLGRQAAASTCPGSGGGGFACPGSTQCCPDGGGAMQCCEAGFSCCVAANGAGSCCPSNGGVCGDGGCSLLPVSGRITSTIFATTTVVRTVTSAPATQSAVIISTVLETLTFINPALQTHTQVVTVTVARKMKRMDVSIPETALGGDPSAMNIAAQPQPTVTLYDIPAYDALETQLANFGVNVRRQAASSAVVTITVTATKTVEVTTTVTIPGTATFTTTIFNTIFVSVTVAPRATTTVFSTTTVRAAPAASTLNDIPGGGVAPTAGSTGSPQNPPILPPGSGGPGSPNPGQGGSNLPAPGTNLPPGATGVLPPGSVNPTGGQFSMAPPGPTSSGSPRPPVSPFPGSPLSSDEIAGIALGVIFGVFFLILAAFLVRRCSKRRQRKQLARDHQSMASASAASGVITGTAATAVVVPARTASVTERPRPMGAALGASDASSGGPPVDGEVRIVIRPAPKRRTQSSGLFPLRDAGPSSGMSSGDYGPRSQWPRPPGYSGQTYSFFIEESGDTTPQDPNQWSVASEYGSGSVSGRRTSGGFTATNTGAGNTQYNSYSNYSQDDPNNYSRDDRNDFLQNDPNNYSRDDRRGDRRDDRTGGGAGGGGGEYLSVGRAMSPWNAI